MTSQETYLTRQLELYKKALRSLVAVHRLTDLGGCDNDLYAAALGAAEDLIGGRFPVR